MIKRFAFASCAALCVVSVAAGQTPSTDRPAYLDPGLPAVERAHDLVSRMTLEEKASQLEDWAVAIPRLGVPSYQTWSEALHGVARAGYATVFPQAIGMGATWDPAMVHQMGDVIAIEGRAKFDQSAARKQSPDLLWADVLVAQHQYFSRSAMGAWAGDVW